MTDTNNELMASAKMVELLNDMLSMTLIEKAHATNVAEACRHRLTDAPRDSMEYDVAYLGAYEASCRVGEFGSDIEALKRIVSRLEGVR